MKRSLIAATAVAATLFLAAPPAHAAANVTAERLQGPNRYVTAEDISETTFPDGAAIAILASGENFPDALAANYLAGATNSPILLTHPDALTEVTADELEELGVAGVVIVGGVAAVSDAVEDELVDLGYEVDRIFGLNRYETAEAIARSLPVENIGNLDVTTGRAAFIATGEKFADALAAGPLAYDNGMPILLTGTDDLSDEAADALDDLEIQEAVILGQEAAVSAEVEDDIEAMGIVVRRVGGANRQATAADIADLAVEELDFSVAHANLARGDNYPDALSGGPNAGELRSVILLTSTPDSLGSPAENWLEGENATIETINVYGGIAAISDAVVADAIEAAET